MRCPGARHRTTRLPKKCRRKKCRSRKCRSKSRHPLLRPPMKRFPKPLPQRRRIRRHDLEEHRRPLGRSEEHTSELKSLMRNSYAVFCLKKQNETKKSHITHSSAPSLNNTHT